MATGRGRTWMDGRLRGRHRRQAANCGWNRGSGVGGGVAYEAAGTSRPGRRTAGQTGKPTTQIEPKSSVARF